MQVKWSWRCSSPAAASCQPPRQLCWHLQQHLLSLQKLACSAVLTGTELPTALYSSSVRKGKGQLHSLQGRCSAVKVPGWSTPASPPLKSGGACG